jgi:hypothetical protein
LAGLLRQQEAKDAERNKNMGESFKDLSALMEKAKEMVTGGYIDQSINRKQ